MMVIKNKRLHGEKCREALYLLVAGACRNRTHQRRVSAAQTVLKSVERLMVP